MSLPNDLASVVTDPQWLPFNYDAQRSALEFAWIPREQHRELTFLADEYVRDLHPPTRAATIAEVRGAAASLDGTPHYIFHSAFACSTLLARALDAPGASMALNEPQVVNQLVLAALQKRLSSDSLQTVAQLLGRPYGPGEAVIVKPSNEANLLAQPLLSLDPRCRALFLYAPLPGFLASVARKGMWGRLWSRRVFANLRSHTGIDFGLSEGDQFQLTDLQVAALTWLSHHAQGASLIAAFPNRVRALDSEAFLANRAEALSAVGSHFGIELDSDRIANGPVFSTHSKEIGRSVDPEAPLDPRAPIPTVEEEIEMVAAWARAVADQVGLPMEMPKQAALITSA